MVSDTETDFNNEQYPPAEDRYEQLEGRLNAMEIQRVPGLDFGDLGLSSGVVIPHKFKAPAFVKYDGASCPKLHLRSYVRKIQPYTADKNLWIHFFQESLSGTHLEWFYQLDGTNIRNWEDLATAFYKQYQYNSDLTPTRTQLQGMSLGTCEGFKEPHRPALISDYFPGYVYCSRLQLFNGTTLDPRGRGCYFNFAPEAEVCP